jgi:leader peptidase (prepilin peptidase) / N-methyltransferase
VTVVRDLAFAAGGLVLGYLEVTVVNHRSKGLSQGPSTWSEWVVAAGVCPGLMVWSAIVHQDLAIALLVGSFLALASVASLSDLERRIIPNALIYPALALYPALILSFWASGVDLRLAVSALGFLAYGGGTFALAVLWRGAMGMGDVKLAALTGLVLGALGWPYVAVAVAMAILSGGIGAVVILVIERGKRRSIPFGPYLTIGAVISAFSAHPIASWYLRRAL